MKKKSIKNIMVGYKIYVRCPHCGKIQPALTFKTKKCIFCGHSFTIFPKRGKSRVVEVKGDYQLYLKDVQRFLTLRKR